ELLFTVAPKDESQLEEVSGLCEVPITRVGEVISERGLRLFKDGKETSLEISGYDHLKGS
ncbi:MAG: thiamine-phosphate kinase, partial [Deltaproteobacteria bacterium]